MDSEALSSSEQPLSINEAIKRSSVPLAEIQLPPSETEQASDFRIDLIKQSLPKEGQGVDIRQSGKDVQITVAVLGAYTYMVRANLDDMSYRSDEGIKPVPREVPEEQQQLIKTRVARLETSTQYLVRSDGTCVDIRQLLQHLAKGDKPSPPFVARLLPNTISSSIREVLTSYRYSPKSNTIEGEIPTTLADIFTMFHEEGHFLRPEKEGLRREFKNPLAPTAFTDSELGANGENLDLAALVKSERDAWAYGHRMLNELRRNGFIKFEDAAFFKKSQENLATYEHSKQRKLHIPGVVTSATAFTNEARKEENLRMHTASQPPQGNEQQ